MLRLTILPSILLLFAAVPLVALGADHPDGTWKWTSNMGEQTINSVLQLETEGGKLSGVYRNQRIETAIENAQLKGDTLSFEVRAEVRERKLVAKFSGKLSRDEISGSVELEVDGQNRGPIDWTANRFVGPDEVVGTWSFDFTSPDEVRRTPVLVITNHDGKLSGEISDDTGGTPVRNLKISESSFQFDLTLNMGDNDLELTYICHPQGNQLTGNLEYTIGEESGDFEIKATRKHLARELRELLGEWQFSMVTPEGNGREATLTLTDNQGELAAQITSDELELTIDNPVYEDGKLTFEFENQHDDLTVKLSWSCHLVSDDEMSGTIAFDANGNTGAIDMTGKRK